MHSESKSSAIAQKLRAVLKSLAQPLLAILAGLVIGGIIIAVTGENPFSVYKTMFTGGFGTVYYFLGTLTRSVPIILCGLGAAFAWRAGYINIGGEGQMIVGGFTSAVVALYLPFGGVLGILVVICAGMLAGGLYAWLAAWLQERFGVLLLISTLMFNYIAHYITYYFVAYPLKDNSVDGIVAKTAVLDQSFWLPRLNWAKGTTFNLGFFIALAVMLVVLFITRKTTFGYESRMGGLNPNFARYGGVKSKKVMYLTMLGSGMLCALGGTTEVLGVKHLYMHEMLKSPSYAWTGL
ncbi:MAG: ABC transporter permease, partial [Oscillospiraceae bacterium]